MTAVRTPTRPTGASRRSSRPTWAASGGVACLILALFVTAGQYKASPLISRLPDLTVVFGGLTALACCARLRRDRGRIPRSAGAVALLFFLMVPGVALLHTSFGLQQTSQFFTLTFLATLAPIILLRSDRAVTYLIGPIALLGGYFAVLALTGKAASSLGRYSALSTNTIQTGRLIGVALIWIVVLTLGRRIRPLVGLLVSVGLIIALVGTGSRGPLLTSVLALLLALLLAPRATARRGGSGYRLLIALIISLALYVGYAYAPIYSRQRIFSVGNSGSDRLEMWRSTLAGMPIHPFGVGYGNWFDWLQSVRPSLAYQLPGVTHPHDLVLLVFIEGGWIPGAALIWFLARAVRAALRSATNEVGIAVLALLIAYISNSLVSDSLNDARTMFLLCGVALARAGWGSVRTSREPSRKPAPAAPPHTAGASGSPSHSTRSLGRDAVPMSTAAASSEISLAWQSALSPTSTPVVRPASPEQSEATPRLGGALRAMTLLGGSTALGQLLLVITTPVVTRLYTPAAVGLFTLYFTYVTFVQTGSSLMYSTAIPTASSSGEAVALTRLSLILSVPYALLGAAAFAVLRELHLFGFEHFPLLAALLCAVSLALTGAFTTFRYLLVRHRRYDGIARALLAQNGARAIGQVGGGLASATWWTMALSDVAGRLFGIGPGLRQLRSEQPRSEIPSRRRVARRYRSFPLVYLPSILIDNLVVWLPLPLITAHYGLTAGGYYAIVSRVIGVPLGVVATSVADVFHGDLALIARSGEHPDRLFRRTTVLLIAVGLPLAVLLYFFSRPVLVAVLGHQWTQAGLLCSLMAPWFLLQFIVSPLSRVVLVYEAQAWKLAYDLLALAAIGVVYAIGVAHHASLSTFVGWLSVAATGCYVVYFLLLIAVIRVKGSQTCAA